MLSFIKSVLRIQHKLFDFCFFIAILSFCFSSLYSRDPYGRASLDGSVVKNLPASARDSGWIPRLGRSPLEGNSNTLQYAYVENPIVRGAWQASPARTSKQGRK